MVWCGVVWCGVVWCGVVCCGTARIEMNRDVVTCTPHAVPLDRGLDRDQTGAR